MSFLAKNYKKIIKTCNFLVIFTLKMVIFMPIVKNDCFLETIISCGLKN